MVEKVNDVIEAVVGTVFLKIIVFLIVGGVRSSHGQTLAWFRVWFTESLGRQS